MKKLLLVLFMVIIAFIGCKEELDEDSPFEGTWIMEFESHHESIIFNGSEFTEKIAGNINYYKGTFTYTSKEISIDRTHVWENNNWIPLLPGPVAYDYTLSNNTLTIVMHNGYPLIYTKHKHRFTDGSCCI